MDPIFFMNNLWVMIAFILVILMQGGFILLEAGSTRMKNAGHIAGKTIFTLGIASIIFWAVGYGLIYGTSAGGFIGTSDFFFGDFTTVFDGLAGSVDFIFQLAFAAIALTIAFGGFAERAKLSVYIIFAVLFSALVYPVVAHWIWGDGWIGGLGKQDFAGSTVVHLTGAMGALAATILLKPRIGKFNKDGSANELAGHNQVFTALGVLLLWVGWFGFNAGSTLGVDDAFFGFVALNTQLGAAAGAVAAMIIAWIAIGKPDVPTMLNGALAGLVAITASCAFVDPWAALVIGLIAGILVFYSMKLMEKLGIDDPIFALSVHGIAGIWGTLSTGFFATPALAEMNGGNAGLFYGGGLTQLGVQAISVLACGVFAFVASYILLLITRALQADSEFLKKRKSWDLISVNTGDMVIQNLSSRQTQILLHSTLPIREPDMEKIIYSEEESFLPQPSFTTYEQIKQKREKETKEVTGNHELLNKAHDVWVAETVLLAIEKVKSERGKAPAHFAFFVMGSGGRLEQSTFSDQDHGIVFQGEDKRCQEYFLKLGEEIREGLAEVGYPRCDGNVMASNPRWCHGVIEWKKQLDAWIQANEWETLRYLITFSDARTIAGKESLLSEVKEHLLERVKQESELRKRIGENTSVLHKGIGIFGQVLTEEKGPYTGFFNVKEAALFPYVHAARMLALKEGMEEPSTLRRLALLKEKYPFLQGKEKSFSQLLELRASFSEKHHHYDDVHYIPVRSLPKGQKQQLKLWIKEGKEMLTEAKSNMEAGER